MKTISKSLINMVKDIPGANGWWSQDSEDDYIELAVELTESGYTEEEAVEFLMDAYWAAAKCFGE